LQYTANNTVDYSASIANSTSAISIDTNGQTVTFANPLAASNTGGLTLNDSVEATPGVVMLTATSGFTGATTIQSGTLRIGINNALPINTAVNITSAAHYTAILDLGGFNQTIGSLTGPSSSAGTKQITNTGATLATLTVNSAANTTFAGKIVKGTGNIALVKSGTGTLTLTNTSNTYTGGTTLAGGTLLLSGNGVLPSNLPTFAGGELLVQGASSNTSTQPLGNLALSAGGSQLLVNPNGGTSTTVNLGTLTGATTNASLGGTLLLGEAAGAGSGTATVTTTTNIGGTGIYGGRVVYSPDGGTTVDWATTTSGSSAYTISGLASGSYTALPTSTTTDTNYILAATTTLTAPSSNIETLKLAPSGTGESLGLAANNLIIKGGGLLATGTNAFTISGTTGKLEAGGDSNYDLILQQYDTGGLTISAVIADNSTHPVTLTKSGPGPLTISNANTYSGGTYVNTGTLTASSNNSLGTGPVTITNGGTLLANNASGSATGTGTVTVNAGGTLGGSGFIGTASPSSANAAITVNSGGTIAAGASSSATGLLTSYSTAGVSLGAGSAYTWKINADTSAGGAAGGTTGWDQIATQSIALGSSGTPLNSNSPFTVNITGAPTFGLGYGTESFPIATAVNGISLNGAAVSSGTNLSTADSSDFVLNTSGFTPPSSASGLTTSWQLEVVGDSGLGGSGQDLDLVYSATPEPGTLMLALGGRRRACGTRC
jgi:autotransporter-associated beta strand protein